MSEKKDPDPMTIDLLARRTMLVLELGKVESQMNYSRTSAEPEEQRLTAQLWLAKAQLLESISRLEAGMIQNSLLSQAIQALRGSGSSVLTPGGFRLN